MVSHQHKNNQYKDTRLSGFAQVARRGVFGRWLSLLWVPFLLMAWTSVAQADDPTNSYAGVALAPVEVKGRVTLASQTMDAVIVEAGDDTLAQIQCVFKLGNLDTLQEAQLVLGFPGQVDGRAGFAPSRFLDLSLSANGQPVTLHSGSISSTAGEEIRKTTWYTWALSLNPGEGATVQLNYQVNLGRELLPTFAYAVTPSAGWPGRVNSARFTIRFPQVTTLEQVVAVSPDQMDFDGQAVEWLFTDFEPGENVTLTFVKPAHWRDIQAARQAVADGPASAQAHQTLGALYRALSQAAGPARPAAADRYYTQAVGELEAAKELAPAQVGPYLALAELYQARATRPDGSLDPDYLVLTIGQWEEALRLRPDDPAIRRALRDSTFAMGIIARQGGRYAEALAYFDRAIELWGDEQSTPFARAEAEEERQRAAAGWGRILLERGQTAEALDLIARRLGSDFPAGDDARRPRWTAIRGEVTTQAGTRSMAFTFEPYPTASAELAQQMEALAAALSSAGRGTVDLETGDNGYRLHIALPFGDEAELAQGLNRLAGAVPADADLALLRAVLGPGDIAFWQGKGPFIIGAGYSEGVDLSAAQAATEAEVSALDAAAAALTTSEPRAEAEEIRLLRLAVLAEYGRAWQQLSEQSVVSYRVAFSALPTARPGRDWLLRPGDTRRLEFATEAYNMRQFALAGAGIALVLLVLVVVAWRVL